MQSNVNKLFTMILLMFSVVSIGGNARADICTDRATLAYQQELNACQNGGGLQCRRNLDCSIGQICSSGLCINQPINCVRRCQNRYVNGACSQYAQDFCGPQAACTMFCAARYLNGQCSQFGADKCANGGIQCMPNCIARYSNGACSQYGADICNGN